MLKIEHLSKNYGNKKAVDDLNLHISPGEIYGFIGHNGAGKTTTLKSVAGILQFDIGEIYIDGKSVRTQPLECKRSFAYIPDNPDLYDYMTGIQYLNFIADIFDVSAADRQRRIRKYGDLFELTGDLAQPVAAYSHGMKQKLAIISAWLHRPKLILMDEPFVGLDPKASHLLKGMMREVCDAGGAIFFSTHVLEVAEKLCDKVAIIVYWVIAGVTLPVVLGGLLMTLLISVFVLIISCVLGWMVAKISQKLKHKSLITVLVSLAVIGIYYFVYFKVQSLIQNLLANATVYGARIKGAAYSVYLFGCIGIGDVRASVIVSTAVAVLFFLMWVLLSHSFLQITTSTGKVVRKEYRETHSGQRSIDAALLGREFSRFTASPNYMLNCGLGTFLMPLCAIAVLWKGGELFEMLDAMFAETEGSVTLLLCVVFCGFVSMNFMTAPSVSLEGKSLWLLQSLPVEPWRICKAKIRMQLLLTGLPLLLCIGCTEVVYSMYWLQLLMILLFGGSYVLLMALVGLFLGIKMPTLTWTNEIMPIKQGGAVIIILLCGFVYTILLFIGFMLLSGWRLGVCRYMSCFVSANLLLSMYCYLWLRKKGVARFSAL